MRSINLPSIISDYMSTETLVTSTGVSVQITKDDPTRWSISITSANAAMIQISTDPAAPAGKGIGLPQANTLVTLDFSKFPGYVSKAFWWINPGLGQTITVIETFMRPRSRD